MLLRILSRPGQSHILSGATGKRMEPNSKTPVSGTAVTVGGLIRIQASLPIPIPVLTAEGRD